MLRMICGIMILAGSVPARSAAQDDLFANSGEACLPAVKSSLTEAIRNGIEGEVKRREQALKMPAPLTGLSCLDSLMDVNLDTAVHLPDLSGLFDKALSDAEHQVCAMAQSEIAKVTEPLQNTFQIPQLRGLELPGMGANGSPDIDYGMGESSIGRAGSDILDTGPRETGRTIMDELYHDLYNKGVM